MQGLLGSKRSHTRSPASVTPRVVCSPHPACSERIRDNGGSCGWPTLCLRTQFRSAGPARRCWPSVVITAINTALLWSAVGLTCCREAAAHLVTAAAPPPRHCCCPSSPAPLYTRAAGLRHPHYGPVTTLTWVASHCAGRGHSGHGQQTCVHSGPTLDKRGSGASPLVRLHSLVLDFSITDRLVLCTSLL